MRKLYVTQLFNLGMLENGLTETMPLAQIEYVDDPEFTIQDYLDCGYEVIYCFCCNSGALQVFGEELNTKLEYNQVKIQLEPGDGLLVGKTTERETVVKWFLVTLDN